MNITKQKMKFLAVKLAALRSELKISKEILSMASREVDQMFKKKYFPEIPVEQEKSKESKIENYSEEQEQTKKQNEQKTTEEDMPASNKNVDPEVRKMFRKIASQCHPDKLHDMDEGFEKKKKEELFEKARTALEDNDLLILSDVALELGMDVPEITAAKLKQAEKKIISIKKELNQIESTLVWHWFFTEDASRKDEILKKLFELMYANNPRSWHFNLYYWSNCNTRWKNSKNSILGHQE